MATINRKELLKKVMAGKIRLVSAYHYDEMTGGDSTYKDMPVAIDPPLWTDRKEGVCYLHASDFNGNSGFARADDTGIIHLHVHSNCFYSLREVDEHGNTVMPRTIRKAEFKLPDNLAVTGPEDQKVKDFLDAWHENGRQPFATSYANSYAAGYYDAEHGHRKHARDRKKFVALDEGDSGVFLVEKETGKVFTIKGYGRPNHYVGMIEELTAKYIAATEHNRLVAR